MTNPISPHQLPYDIFRHDRPGWIPEWIGDDWDPDPYAYQTAEELMPVGHFHSRAIQLLAEILRPPLERVGLQLVIDAFVFYRDLEGRKQRIAPDILIAPATEDELDLRNSYDLDIEPLPLCVVEVISPRNREAGELRRGLYYAALGIEEYLLLDVQDKHGRAREQIGITLMRLAGRVPQIVEPDPEGYLTLATIGVRLRAEGQRLVAQVVETGEFLKTTTELAAALAAAEQARMVAEQARVATEQVHTAEQARTTAEQRAEAEATARQQAEEELARLRAEVARLRQATD